MGAPKNQPHTVLKLPKREFTAKYLQFRHCRAILQDPILIHMYVRLNCPRDGSILVLPRESDRSTFSRHGIHHCDECSGMLLNAAAASSTISEQKLNKMHNAFEIGGDEVDLDCPFCDSQMRFRNIVFSRLDGTEMEPIEIDGCPSCSSFWFDAGELQKISPPVVEYDAHREANALSIVMEMLMHLPFVII